MLKYRIIPEKSLIILEIIDKVNFQDLMAGIKEYKEDPDYASNFTGVVDFRHGELQLDYYEIKQVADFVINESFAKGVWCHIVKNPKNTALGALYATMIREEHPIKIFSTLYAASRYVGIDLSEYLEPDDLD